MRRAITASMRHGILLAPEIIRFGVVGFATFMINFGVFHLSFENLGFDYMAAVTVAYCITVCCHFFLNKYFTFGDRSQKFIQNAGRYGALLAINYGITMGMSWVVVEGLHLSPYLGIVGSTAGTAISSFLMMKLFVFRRSPTPLLVSAE